MYASVATSVMVMMLLMMNTSVNRRRKDVLCHSFDVFDEKVGSFDSDYPSDFFNDEYSTPICECSRRLGKFKDRACRKEVRQHSTDKLREIIGILLEEISTNGATGSVAENIGKLLKPTSGGLSAMFDNILKSAINLTRHQPLMMPYWDFRMDLNTEMPQRSSIIEHISIAYGGSDEQGTALDRSFQHFSEMVLSLRSADPKWSLLSKVDAFGSVPDKTWRNRQRAFELTEHFIAQRSDNASVVGGRLLQIFFMVSVDNQIDANCSCVDFDESSCAGVSRWLQWDMSLERCVARLIPQSSTTSLPTLIPPEPASEIDGLPVSSNKSDDVHTLPDGALVNETLSRSITPTLPALLTEDTASSTPYTKSLVSSSGEELQLLFAPNSPDFEGPRGNDNIAHEEFGQKKTETINSLASMENSDDQNAVEVSTTVSMPTVVGLDSDEEFGKPLIDLPTDVGVLLLSVGNEISAPKPWSGDNSAQRIYSSTTFSPLEMLPEKVEATLDSLNSTPKTNELKTIKKHHRKHHKKYRHRHTQSTAERPSTVIGSHAPRTIDTTTTILPTDDSVTFLGPTTVIPPSFDVTHPMATADYELRKYNTFYEAPVHVSSPDSTDLTTTIEPLTLNSLNSAEAVFAREFDSLRSDEPRLRKGYGGDDLIINSGSKDYNLIVDPIVDRKSSYSEPQRTKSVDFESDGDTSILAKSSRFLKNSENKKIKHKDEANNLDVLLKYLTKPKLPKGTILWKSRRAPIPLVYFTITLINGPLSRRRRPLPSNKRRVRGARIYITGLNMPTGYTQITEGIQVKGDNAALVRTLNPQTTGPFVEFKIRVENKYGAVCKQMCLDASQRYRRCARRAVRLSTFKRFSDPIPFYQSAAEALDSQWTGKGYYRRRKYDYLLFRCEE